MQADGGDLFDSIQATHSLEEREKVGDRNPLGNMREIVGDSFIKSGITRYLFILLLTNTLNQKFPNFLSARPP